MILRLHALSMFNCSDMYVLFMQARMLKSSALMIITLNVTTTRQTLCVDWTGIGDKRQKGLCSDVYPLLVYPGAAHGICCRLTVLILHQYQPQDCMRSFNQGLPAWECNAMAGKVPALLRREGRGEACSRQIWHSLEMNTVISRAWLIF